MEMVIIQCLLVRNPVQISVQSPVQSPESSFCTNPINQACSQTHRNGYAHDKYMYTGNLCIYLMLFKLSICMVNILDAYIVANHIFVVIKPRRACARVMVVVLCVCLSGDTSKPGPWTLDWTMDWTVD